MTSTSRGITYNVPPHRRRYSKETRTRGNMLFMTIHSGFITFYLARGIRPPTVSTTRIEQPIEFLDYAQRWGDI